MSLPALIRPFLRPSLLCAALLTVGACGADPTEDSLEEAAAEQAQTVSAATAAAAGEAPDTDALFGEMARRLPGFGGLFYDEDGRLVAYLAKQGEIGPREQAQVHALVAATLGPEELPAAGVEVRPAEYSFPQLKKWHDDMAASVLGLPGVVYTDIDERENRITIGVSSASLTSRVQADLERAAVPQAAVRIIETEPVYQHATLQDYSRPLQGGLQIAFGQSLCTLGFNAVRSGVTGFVTNSHCTNTQGGVEGTQYYQPAISTANRIGVESADPPYFSGGACPTGRRCRRSDSAFIRKDAAVAASQGFIAATGLSSLAITGSYRIVAEGAALVGMTLNKVGRTTGRTQGTVSGTCQNFPAWKRLPDGTLIDTGITLLCQTSVSAGADSGDSGSPVLRIASATDAHLHGIEWAGNSSLFVFSPIANIQGELGAVTTCAPPFGC